MNASRQSGKSSTTAVVAAHQALYNAGSLVLLLSPSLRQSAELFRKVKDIINAAGGATPTEVVEESALRLQFANESRIVSLPGREG